MLESNILLSTCDDVIISGVPTSSKYCLQPIIVTERKYVNNDFIKMCKKDPRNKLYYEKPKKIENKFLNLLLYYTHIPLEDVEEEWIIETHVINMKLTLSLEKPTIR
jgi:hypothetical protein